MNLNYTKLQSRLATYLAEHAGMDKRALDRGHLNRALVSLGSEPEAESLLQLAEHGDPGACQRVYQSALTGETYFFRHAEHFSLAASQAASFSPQNKRNFRAWSAGCSSGEEAYSLAHILHENLPAVFQGHLEVWATDINEDALAQARSANYTNWSYRDETWRVAPFNWQGPTELEKSMVQLRSHNLLHKPNFGPELFDLIFCRNVLIYLSEDASRAVISHLASALTPGGLLVMGAMDLRFIPQELYPLDPIALGVWRRRKQTLKKTRTQASQIVAAPTAQLEKNKIKNSPLAVHQKAIALMEAGSEELALKILSDLEKKSPLYLPAIFELAMLENRMGHTQQAVTRLLALSRLLQDKDDKEKILAPESISVGFYRQAIRAFLKINQVQS